MHGEAGVSELRCSAHVIHKVLAAMFRVAYLPAFRQGAQFQRVNLYLSEARVVPCADPCTAVDKIDLTLRGRPLFWRGEGGRNDMVQLTILELATLTISIWQLQLMVEVAAREVVSELAWHPSWLAIARGGDSWDGAGA